MAYVVDGIRVIYTYAFYILFIDLMESFSFSPKMKIIHFDIHDILKYNLVLAFYYGFYG